MFKLAVLASGRGSNLQSIIDKLHLSKEDIKISCVISNNERAHALKRAKENNISFHLVDDQKYVKKGEYEREMIRIIDKFNVDLIVLAGYMKILSSEFIDHYKDKVINIHPSLLPAFPGLNAQKQAVDYGVKISGCTVHFVDEGVDTGPIIKQKAVYVNYEDNEDSLSRKILKFEHQLLPKAIRLIAEGKVLINKNRTVKIEEGEQGE